MAELTKKEASVIIKEFIDQNQSKKEEAYIRTTKTEAIAKIERLKQWLGPNGYAILVVISVHLCFVIRVNAVNHSCWINLGNAILAIIIDIRESQISLSECEEVV